MAAYTLSDFLPHNDRDLDQTELGTLEAMVDAAGIEAVVQGLSEICGLKADHIAHAWQDAALAKRWATMGRGVGCSVHEGNRAVGHAFHQRGCIRADRMQPLPQPLDMMGANQWPRLTPAYTSPTSTQTCPSPR
jgi:hypothetical protein